MFGKTEWFQPETHGVAPAPRSVRGWLYYGLWLAVIAVPAVLLVSRGQLPECAIWAAISGGVCMLDLRRLRSELRQQDAISRMHFIADEEPRPIETENYRLEIKS